MGVANSTTPSNFCLAEYSPGIFLTQKQFKMKDLKFLETTSLAKFKDLLDITQIDVIKNPKTGKLFFVASDDNSVSGKISETFDSTASVSVSKCQDAEGEEFYMLHNTAESNVQFSL